MSIWVKLPRLPLDCWNSNALENIASKIRKPNSTDKLTSTRGRLFYARVLVEVDASKDLVRTISMKLPTNKSREQPVVYEHEPKFCLNCKIFRHKTAACNMKNKAGEPIAERIETRKIDRIVP